MTNERTPIHRAPIKDVLDRLKDSPLPAGVAELIAADFGAARSQQSAARVEQATAIVDTDPGEAMRLALLACDDDPELSEAVSDTLRATLNEQRFSAIMEGRSTAGLDLLSRAMREDFG